MGRREPEHLGASAADDLLGEVFRVAFECRSRFQFDRQSARPWLYGIATNQVQHWWRSRARSEAALRRVANAETNAAELDIEALELPIGTVRSRIHRLRVTAMELISAYRENDGVTAAPLTTQLPTAPLELKGPRP